MARRLRSGYTTGACAAAAAKAAVLLLLGHPPSAKVEIPFPDGSRHCFAVHQSARAKKSGREGCAWASVLKDAGDDPDVTNGAEIVASVSFPLAGEVPNGCVRLGQTPVFLHGGAGVGRVTKRGLAIMPGEPAINPAPRRMILDAVLEALGTQADMTLQVGISVPRGEELAEKTLNKRLGIVGGLSILGTTGIVRPVSADAWTATIEASLAVAREAGLKEAVLSTGRTSEKGAQTLLSLPEEAYAMMGDYLEFSLLAAARRGFTIIHLAGMWAKIMKAALQIPQTHVRHGALEVRDGLALLAHLGADAALLASLGEANTAREMYERLREQGRDDLIQAVCKEARRYAEKVSGLPVRVYLVNSHSQVEVHV